MRQRTSCISNGASIRSSGLEGSTRSLGDPLTALATGLINMGRPNEGLRIAEEKLLPNEEEFVDSIIQSFAANCCSAPGRFERGGNTKHAWHRARRVYRS